MFQTEVYSSQEMENSFFRLLNTSSGLCTLMLLKHGAIDEKGVSPFTGLASKVGRRATKVLLSGDAVVISKYMNPSQKRKLSSVAESELPQINLHTQGNPHQNPSWFSLKSE